nr:MAG TPA: hypothetical protein [Caudoviricetes sp.]
MYLKYQINGVDNNSKCKIEEYISLLKEMHALWKPKAKQGILIVINKETLDEYTITLSFKDNVYTICLTKANIEKNYDRRLVEIRGTIEELSQVLGLHYLHMTFQLVTPGKPIKKEQIVPKDKKEYHFTIAHEGEGTPVEESTHEPSSLERIYDSRGVKEIDTPTEEEVEDTTDTEAPLLDPNTRMYRNVELATLIDHAFTMTSIFGFSAANKQKLIEKRVKELETNHLTEDCITFWEIVYNEYMYRSKEKPLEGEDG